RSIVTALFFPLFFFYFFRPPPIPTLFPYTTLFRSQPLEAIVMLEEEQCLLHNRVHVHLPLLPRAGPGKVEQAVDDAAAALHLCVDRKSTRLNSSHDQISYAVFCLKKKKKNKNT